VMKDEMVHVIKILAIIMIMGLVSGGTK
jgi:hypothetical protein